LNCLIVAVADLQSASIELLDLQSDDLKRNFNLSLKNKPLK